MNDDQKSEEELIKELANLRQYVETLENQISKQEQLIEELRKSEERYKLLFNNNNIGIIHFDISGRYILLNELIARQLGGKPSDFIGKKFYEVFPNSTNFQREQFAKVIGERKAITFEDSFILATGTYWHSSYLQPIVDHTNEVIGIEVVSIDITARKKMEEQLHYQSKLIEMSSEAIISTDMNFIIQSWNPAAESMYGWTAQEVIGKSMTVLVSAEYLHTSREEVLATFATQGYFSGEFIHHHKDGTPIYLWGSVTTIKNNAGEPIGAVSVNRDITKRKEVEDALLDSQENMAEAQRIAHMGSWNLNILTNEIYWSDEMYRIYGVDKGKVSEIDIIYELIHPNDLEIFRSAIDSAFNGNVPEFVEYRIIRPDGKMRHLRATAQTYYDKSGQFVRMIGTTQDITESKILETLAVENERLKTQFKNEQEQNELIQRIISTLSHDMRTPLSIITLSRDMLKLYFDKQDTERRNEILDTILHQTQFATQLLEDTVQMARGQHRFDPQPINLATLCQVSIDEIDVTNIARHKLKFYNVGKVKTVSVDETLVSRILLNLLSNAIKYSPEGGEVRLTLNIDGSGIILCVTDQGIGIHPDELPHIFELLFRAENVDDIQGTGLGLSIVKDCVERHNGEITVESELNKGSIFTVHLPV